MTSNALTNSILLALSREFKAVAWRHNCLRAQVVGRWVRSSPDGVSDIIGCVGGKFLALEIKMPGDTLSDAQYGFLDSVSKNGGIALVCGRKPLKKIPPSVACFEDADAAMRYINIRLYPLMAYDDSDQRLHA